MIRYYIVYLRNGKVINIEPYEDKTVRDQAWWPTLQASAKLGVEVQLVDLD